MSLMNSLIICTFALNLNNEVQTAKSEIEHSKFEIKKWSRSSTDRIEVS